MKQLILKIKFIYFPFLILCIAFILCYTFIHWLLFIQFHLFTINESIDFILPSIFLILSIILWWRPKSKFVHSSKILSSLFTESGSISTYSRSSLLGGLLLTGWLIVMVYTLSMTQSYLEDTTSKLTEILDVTHIHDQPLKKYYTVSNYYIDKSNTGFYYDYTSYVHGKFVKITEWKFNAYIVIPIYADSLNSQNKESIIWLGVKYTKTVKGNLYGDEVNEKMKEFKQDCKEKFNETDFRQFVYLKNISNDEDQGKYKLAIELATPPNYKYDHNIIFSPHYEPFSNRNWNKLLQIAGYFLIFSIIPFILLFVIKLDEDKLRNNKNDVKEIIKK